MTKIIKNSQDPVPTSIESTFILKIDPAEENIIVDVFDDDIGSLTSDGFKRTLDRDLALLLKSTTVPNTPSP